MEIAAGVMPVPDKEMVCGEFGALSATSSDAVAWPAAVGTKLTASVQAAPCASGAVHPLVSENRAGSVPVNETALDDEWGLAGIGDGDSLSGA